MHKMNKTKNPLHQHVPISQKKPTFLNWPTRRPRCEPALQFRPALLPSAHLRHMRAHTHTHTHTHAHTHTRTHVRTPVGPRRPQACSHVGPLHSLFSHLPRCSPHKSLGPCPFTPVPSVPLSWGLTRSPVENRTRRPYPLPPFVFLHGT